MPECIIETNTIKKIYFVGIKGVGMTALSIIAKEAGFIVSGSDIEEEFLTDEILKKNNIYVNNGFSLESIKEFIEGFEKNEVLLVTTAAHEGFDNPQCRYAKEQGVKVITHGQAVGVFMNGGIFKRKLQGISILGCHGKTTLTAMVATLLSHLGQDPSYAAGTSELFPLGNPGHFGRGEYFIAEADEFISEMNYDRTVKFLYQYPKIAIINNIDFDHPDVYKNLEEVYQAFLTFARENILKNGTLIINGDDQNSIRLKNELESLRQDLKIVTFGESPLNIIQMKKLRLVGWGSEFEVSVKNQYTFSQKVNIPGLHNAKNMLGAIALLYSINEREEKIRKAVEVFKGSKRRQERLGQTKNGAIVIDDYAHHPDEIEKTIQAVKGSYPDKKVIVIFQPHTVGRTQSLAGEFALAFSSSENVIFLPIFSSKREGDKDYSEIYEKIEKQMKDKGIKVEFFKDERDLSERSFSPYFLKKYRSNVVKYTLNKFDSNEYVILTLGAGDVYKIGYDLMEN